MNASWSVKLPDTFCICNLSLECSFQSSKQVEGAKGDLRQYRTVKNYTFYDNAEVGVQREDLATKYSLTV